MSKILAKALTGAPSMQSQKIRAGVLCEFVFWEVIRSDTEVQSGYSIVVTCKRFFTS